MQNKLFIDAPFKVNAQVFDRRVKLLLEVKNVETIDIGQFANATYLLKLSDENGNNVGVQRVMKR